MFSALTFNMQNGQVWDEENPEKEVVRLDDTIAFLREQQADVIFLQEVEQGFDGGLQLEPPPNYQKLLDALPEYHGVFAYPQKNPDELPFGLGLSILTKTPLRNFQKIDLPAPNLSFVFGGRTRRPSQRVLLSVETAIDGRVVRLMNTHLQAFFMVNSTSDEHRAQRDLVEQELRGQDVPTLLAGDFNSAPTESLLAQFSSAGFEPVQREEITWRRMPFVLDHIFHNAAFRVERVQVLPTLASDHHGVRAEFSFV